MLATHILECVSMGMQKIRLVGPPGNTKTSTTMNMAIKMLMSNPKIRIIWLAAQNAPLEAALEHYNGCVGEESEMAKWATWYVSRTIGDTMVKANSFLLRGVAKATMIRQSRNRLSLMTLDIYQKNYDAMKQTQEGYVYLTIFDESQVTGEEKMAAMKSMMEPRMLMITVGDEKQLGDSKPTTMSRSAQALIEIIKKQERDRKQRPEMDIYESAQGWKMSKQMDTIVSAENIQWLDKGCRSSGHEPNSRVEARDSPVEHETVDIHDAAQPTMTQHNTSARRTYATINRLPGKSHMHADDDSYVAKFMGQEVDTAAMAAFCIMALGMKPTNENHRNRAAIHALNRQDEHIKQTTLDFSSSRHPGKRAQTAPWGGTWHGNPEGSIDAGRFGNRNRGIVQKINVSIQQSGVEITGWPKERVKAICSVLQTAVGMYSKSAVDQSDITKNAKWETSYQMSDPNERLRHMKESLATIAPGSAKNWKHEKMPPITRLIAIGQAPYTIPSPVLVMHGRSNSCIVAFWAGMFHQNCRLSLSRSNALCAGAYVIYSNHIKVPLLWIDFRQERYGSLMNEFYQGKGVQPANPQGCKMCMEVALGIMNLHEEQFSTGSDKVDVICAYKSDEEYIQTRLNPRGGSTAKEWKKWTLNWALKG